jgi:D-alanyl-lipoteichoic acid acyltransferase DltB (MBOAT superfamily)
MANSPKAFWKRWHISLSNWIKDYLYIPLTGKKVVLSKQEAISEIRSSSNLKGYLALFLTWAIMGFWHGANWCFIIWGLYHATLVMVHRMTSRYTSSWNKTFLNAAGWCVSLPFLMLGWIPFRVTNLSIVKAFFLKILTPSQYLFMGLRENIYLITFLLLLLIVLAYLIVTYVRPKIRETYFAQIVDVSVLSGAIALVIIFLRPISQFIYFQF